MTQIPRPSELAPQLPPESRTWAIEIPPGTEFLTANDHISYFAKNAINRDLKELAGDLVTKIHRMPALSFAEFEFAYTPPPRRKADRHPLASKRVEDPDALFPTGKALIDGIVQAGVLPNDSRRYVGSVHYSLSSGSTPRGLLVMTITGTVAGG